MNWKDCYVSVLSDHTPWSRQHRPRGHGRHPFGPLALGGIMHASISHARRSPHRLILDGRGPATPFPRLWFRARTARVSRWNDRLARRRLPALVGHGRISVPHSFLSTPRTTRRLRCWASEPALATSEAQAELLGPSLDAALDGDVAFRGRLCLIATVLKDVIRVRRDPDIG